MGEIRMQSRYFIIGNVICKLFDYNNIDIKKMLGINMAFGAYDYEIYIKPIEDVFSSIPDVYKKINNPYQGISGNDYYTVYRNYGLVAITRGNSGFIEIGLKENVISAKSYYLIRSVIIKHICRLVFKTLVPLHAACISGYDGRLILFVGKSGAGKSTLTRYFLSLGCSFINDDVVALDVEESIIFGFSEGTYIRPESVDFYLKQGIAITYEEVSPGRKLFIDNKDKKICSGKPSCIVLLDSEYNQNFTIMHCEDEIRRKFMDSHMDWCKSSFEKKRMLEAINHLSTNCLVVFASLNNIDDLIDFIKMKGYM